MDANSDITITRRPPVPPLERVMNTCPIPALEINHDADRSLDALYCEWLALHHSCRQGATGDELDAITDRMTAIYRETAQIPAEDKRSIARKLEIYEWAVGLGEASDNRNALMLASVRADLGAI